MNPKKQRERDRKEYQEYMHEQERIKVSNQHEHQRLQGLDKSIEKLKAINEIKKDWGELKKLSSIIEKNALEISDVIDLLSESMSKLEVLLEKAYYTAPEVDINNFNGSPFGPIYVSYYLRTHMIKNGIKSMGHIIQMDPTKVRSFHDNIKDALKWIMKLEKGGQLHGTIKQREQQLKHQSGQ